LKHMEIQRRHLIYKFFIEQFMEMSRVSMKYLYFEHGNSLLNHALRIVDLMIDDRHFEESKEYSEKIQELFNKISELKTQNSQGPELPRRMSAFENETKRARYRAYQSEECDINNNNNVNEEEVASEDDNDEIYSYHRSIVAQVHATSSENLARFQHSDETDEYEMNDIGKSIDEISIADETKF
jgi:hypothetical protein